MQAARDELFTTASGLPPPPADQASSTEMFPAPPALNTLTETLEIGGATLETLASQTTSLEKSRDCVHNENYLLTKSDRILRGMGSWSGWAYNTFISSQNTELRSSQAAISTKSARPSAAASTNLTYTGADPVLIDLYQQLASFIANAEILRTVPDEEIRATLSAVCGDLATKIHQLAEQNRRFGGDERGGHFERVVKEVKRWGDLGEGGGGREELMRGADHRPTHTSSTTITTASSHPSSSATTTTSQQQLHMQQQDSDLASLQLGLGSLNTMALQINQTLGEQNAIISDIDAGSDVANEKMRRVVRRTGRLNKKSGWKEPALFISWTTISAVIDGNRLFLGVKGETLTLVEEARARFGGSLRDCIVWGFYRRNAYNAVGLRVASTNNYLGQNSWGNFTCSATKMGTNEEWEVDDETKMASVGTQLLSSSAGWGAGAYVSLNCAAMEKDSVNDWAKCAFRTKPDKMNESETNRFYLEFVDYSPPFDPDSK